MVVAVNGAPLVGETRWAEARCRFVFGVTVFSAGVPMFLYDRVLQHKPDLEDLRRGIGAGLYVFYRDAITLRRGSAGLRSRAIEVIHVHNANRVIAFRRWDGLEEFLVIASLNNRPFGDGYEMRHPSTLRGDWRQLLSSDALAYGGAGVTKASVSNVTP